MGRYLRKKIGMMPGDPVQSLLSRFSGMEGGREILEDQLTLLFNLDQSIWQQYANFWKSVFTLDFGISIIQFPTPVLDIIQRAIVYDLAVLLPAIILSWVVGNKLGAYSGTDKKVDKSTMPIFYFLASSPYFWMAGIVAFFFGVVLGWFPISGAYGSTASPGFNWSFISDFLHHWFLPFFTMFLVQLGGWAIGMRNMIMYEKSSNYSKYMETLGSSKKLIRKYGFRNGVLPQVTGLALRLGRIVGGAITVQVVFNYPGLGRLLLDAVQNQDYFLMQGIFLTIVTMVLVANFTVDIVYMFIDPRVRLSFTEEV